MNIDRWISAIAPVSQRKARRWLLLSSLTCWLVLALETAAWGQFPALPTNSTPAANAVPTNVQRYGNIEVAPVKAPIDDKVLFEVTAPTVFDRSKPENQANAVETRAEQVTANLERVHTQFFTPVFKGTLKPEQVQTVVAILNKVPIIEVTAPTTSRPIRIVSVTDLDAEYQVTLASELAEEWRTIVEKEVQTLLTAYAATSYVKAIRAIGLIFLALMGVTGVLWFVRRLLNQRLNAIAALPPPLASEPTEPLAAETPPVDLRDHVNLRDQQSQLVQRLQSQFSLERRQSAYQFLRWVIIWLIAFLWYAGLAAMVRLLPGLSHYMWDFLSLPITLLAIWFFTGLAIRISRGVINRLTKTWRDQNFLTVDDAQRWSLRTTTIANALKGFATVVIAIAGGLFALSRLGIPTGSVVAIGGILALAFSFGSQSLVKDFVNGILILVEDQFAVGDVIHVNGKGGLVENLNLRVTQLRNGEGALITIPNSAITEVENLSRQWSRVDFSIDVDYESDLEKALNLLRDISKTMYEEPEWRDRLIGLPEVLGCDGLSHAGMTLRVWIKTQPLQQWAVGREFRYRVRTQFESHHIQIGRPQLVRYDAPSSDADAIAAQPE